MISIRGKIIVKQVYWIWIATHIEIVKFLGTGSGNSTILAPNSSDQENCEKTPLFETKAAENLCLLQFTV